LAALTRRRFPPLWTIEEQEACFVVRDQVYVNWRRSLDAAAPLPSRSLTTKRGALIDFAVLCAQHYLSQSIQAPIFVPLSPADQKNIDVFFGAIAPYESAFRHIGFSTWRLDSANRIRSSVGACF
jgi:hypothetical protein